MKQPFRIELCKLLLDGKTRTQREILQELSPLYEGERQLMDLEDHLQSMRAVGLIQVDKEWVEECSGQKKLIQSWVLTSSARTRLQKVL